LWESRVTAEFQAQSEMEVELGVPVSPFMSNLHDHHVRWTNHLNFIDLVMMPLWKVVGDVLPPMQQCVTSLQHNRQLYQQRLHDSTHDDDRRPLTDGTTSSSPASIAVSVAVTPSATTPHSPTDLSPQNRRGGGGMSASQSGPSSPSIVYHALDEQEEEDEVKQDGGGHR
jgi:hypothetical protein